MYQLNQLSGNVVNVRSPKTGADVNAKDNEGNTPLFVAYAVKNNDAVNLLINSGADTTIKNNLGVTYNRVVGARKRDFYSQEGKVDTINDDFD